MTLQVRLYRAQRRRIQLRLRKTRDRIEALRCRVLLLVEEGHGVSEVAYRAGCVRATVYRTLYRFEQLSEDGLRDQRLQRPARKVTPEVQERLVSYLDTCPRDLGWQRASWTLELLALQLEQDTGVQLSTGHLRVVLQTLGVRRGRPRPALRIPVRGRRKVLRSIQRLVQRAGPQAEVFYVDEADVDLNPRIGFTYHLRGQQPLVLTPGTNVKRYVAGALNARTGKVVHVVAERKDSSLFLALLDALRRKYRHCSTLHLVLDNYIGHKSRRTQRRLAKLGSRFVLHFLPPYSPEHNVIERLWKQLHDHVTRNHRHANIESLLEAVEEFLRSIQPFPGTKVSIARTALLT